MRRFSLIAIAAVTVIISGCSATDKAQFLSSSGPQYGKGHEMRAERDPRGWNRDGANVYERAGLGKPYQASNGRICADYAAPMSIRGQRHVANGTVCQDRQGEWRPIWTQF